MNVDTLHKYCGTKQDIELISVLDVTKGTISKWRSKGIPAERQAVYQVLTGNAIKAADLSAFKIKSKLKKEANHVPETHN